MIKRVVATLILTGASFLFAGNRVPQVRDFVEERVEMEGTLQVLIEDRYDGSRQLSYLETDSGERFALHFATPPTRLMTGERVIVTGFRTDSSIAVDSEDISVRRVTTGATTSGMQATSVMSGAFGARKTAVILVNFTDKATQPYTVANARDTVFTTVSNFDLENSYGQTWLTGDVFGWYTIAQSATVCDSNTTVNLAKSAAAAAGANLSNYNHFVIGFPGNACGWWGLGTVGGAPSTAWINGSFALQVVAHEMGHNFGLYHSHSLDCGSVPLGTGCTMDEYGDIVDNMGYSSYHFNAYQKERLGWLNYGASPPVTTVSSSGTYTISPMETAGSSSKALKIARTGTSSYFYLELRRGIGYDAALVSNSNITNGVVVHLASPSDGNSSDLLDMTATATFSDPALTVGQTFTDSLSGVRITVNAVSATDASVSVTMGGAPSPTPTPSPSASPSPSPTPTHTATPTPTPAPSCTHVSPLVTLTTTQAAGVASGTQVTYTLTVTNRDASPCTTSTFTLTNAVPSGWTGALTAGSLSLAKGATGSTTLKVTSSFSAANGAYTVSATGKNSSATTAAATASSTYTVSNPPGGGGVGGSFNDSFDRTDSTTLGSNWAAADGNFVVAGNVLKTKLGLTGNNLSVVAALSGPTQSVEADFTSVDNNLGPKFGLVLRYQDSHNYYLIHRVTGGSSRLYISKVVNGVQTDLAKVSIGNPTKNVAFHIKGRASGSTLSLDFGGVNKLNFNDATFSSGKVGIQMFNKQTNVQQQADNFQASAY